MSSSHDFMTIHYFTQLEIAAGVWRATPNDAAFRNYKDHYEWALRIIHRQYREDPRNNIDSERLDQALRHLPTLQQAFISAQRNLPGELSDWILDLLVIEQSNTTINTMANKDAVLAWFSCEHSVRYLNDYEEQAAAKFRQFISSWTGIALGERVNPLPGVVVGLLYGKPCWDLYGCDFEDGTDEEAENAAACVLDISTMQLPLIFKESLDIGIAVMPDNLFD